MELDSIKIDKGNRAIVRFMQYNADEYAVVVNMHGYAYDQLKFHESFDWLKPVVDRICSQISCRIVPSSPYEVFARKIAVMPFSNSITTMWNAVLDYISWYESPEAKHSFAIDDECRMHFNS